MEYSWFGKCPIEIQLLPTNNLTYLLKWLKLVLRFPLLSNLGNIAFVNRQCRLIYLTIKKSEDDRGQDTRGLSEARIPCHFGIFVDIWKFLDIYIPDISAYLKIFYQPDDEKLNLNVVVHHLVGNKYHLHFLVYPVKENNSYITC